MFLGIEKEEQKEREKGDLVIQKSIRHDACGFCTALVKEVGVDI
ncbi:MAG: hypothetical protein V8S98_01150 [Lachnospiraceae bacterium]